MDRKMVAERRRDATVVDWPRVVFSSCAPSNPHVSTTLDDDDFCFWMLSRALFFGLLRAVVVPRTDADASTDDGKEEEDDANIL